MLRLNLIENTEEQLINQIFLPLTRNSQFAQKLQDDIAFIQSCKKIIIKTDSLTEGIHLKIGASPFGMGYKLLARCISDIACKGGFPIAFTLSIFKPKNFSVAQMKEFADGLKSFKIPLIGGDISNTPNSFFSANITIFAEHNNKKISARFCAKPSENIYITGKVGLAFLGFIGIEKFIQNYEMPKPDLKLMQKIFSKYNIGASIDISDGFIKDLSSLLCMSKVGAEIEIQKIILKKFTSYTKDMLTFGDDYKVIFTSKEEIKEKGIIKIGKTNASHILTIKDCKVDINNAGYTFTL